MDTNEGVVVAGRCRRRHSDAFKAEAVRACEQPGVSMVAVALGCGVNANLLRRWVLQHRASCGTAAAAVPGSMPAFVALTLPAPEPELASAAPIHIELKRGATTVNVHWPTCAATDCAAWLRELLR